MSIISTVGYARVRTILSKPGRFPDKASDKNRWYPSTSETPRSLLSPKSRLASCLPITSSSGEITRESTGECSCHPLMIACANGCVVSTALKAVLDPLCQIGALIWRASEGNIGHPCVLIKCSFKNLMFCSSERAPEPQGFTTSPQQVFVR